MQNANETTVATQAKTQPVRVESVEALPHPPDLEPVVDELEALPHPPSLEPAVDELEALPHPPDLEPVVDELEEPEHAPRLDIIARFPQESCWQYCFRRILAEPKSRDGIYLARILLSLTDGTTWPYPLAPSLDKLSEDARRLGVEMAYAFLDRGGKVTEHWWAKAIAKDAELADFSFESGPMTAWLNFLDKVADATAEVEETIQAAVHSEGET